MKSKIMISVMMVAALLFTTSIGNTLSAQGTKVKTEDVKTKKYYCPHHPDKVSDKTGKCAVCGMDLVEMKAVKYACPHHPDKVSDKPGKCECGMDLVEVKDAKMDPAMKMKMNSSDEKTKMK